MIRVSLKEDGHKQQSWILNCHIADSRKLGNDLIYLHISYLGLPNKLKKPIVNMIQIHI